MTDPRRLLEVEDGVSSIEQRVLEAAARISAPPGARASVWAKLAPQIGVAAGTAAAMATSSAAAATKSTLLVSALKAGAIGAVLGATTIGGVLWVAPTNSPPPRAVQSVPARPEPAPPVRQPRAGTEQVPRSVATKARSDVSKPRAPSTARSPGPVAAPSAPATLGPPSAVTGSRAAFPDAPPEGAARATPRALSSAERIRLESQRLAEARGLLRSGEPDAALGALDELTRDFPNGILAQEREALRVQALLAAGKRSEAGVRARAFLQSHPNSPHAADVRRALE